MKRSEKISTIKEFGSLLAVYLLCMASLCCLTGLLVSKEIITQDFGGLIVRVMFLCNAFVFCCCQAKKAARQRMTISLFVAGAIILIGLSGKGILFPEDHIQWIRVAVLCAIGALGGLISSKKKAKKYR